MENKVYKLKVEYPGSPKEGTVIVETETGYEGLGITFSEKKFVENYPNNWDLQKVKPIYEILNFFNKENLQIYFPSNHTSGYFTTLKQNDYSESPIGSRNIDYCLKFYQIHSVRRLSDGEVFALGDIVRVNSIITSFEPTKSGLRIVYNNGFTHVAQTSGLFDRLKKVKKPLFKTEDGVDIFEPTILYGVIKKSLNLITCLPNEISDSQLYFEYYEKAEEYIKMNRPEFSRNQIISLLDKLHLGDQIVNFFINELDKK